MKICKIYWYSNQNYIFLVIHHFLNSSVASTTNWSIEVKKINLGVLKTKNWPVSVGSNVWTLQTKNSYIIIDDLWFKIVIENSWWSNAIITNTSDWINKIFHSWSNVVITGSSNSVITINGETWINGIKQWWTDSGDNEPKATFTIYDNKKLEIWLNSGKITLDGKETDDLKEYIVSPKDNSYEVIYKDQKCNVNKENGIFVEHLA